MTETALRAYMPTVATLIVLGIGLLFNNSRISDLNTNLNKRIDDLRTDSARQFDELRNQYSQLERVILGKLAEVEVRLDRIETHLNLR